MVCQQELRRKEQDIQLAVARGRESVREKKNAELAGLQLKKEQVGALRMGSPCT